MPMPLDEKKRGAVYRIIAKKFKDGQSYDEMKRYNSEDALKHDEEEIKSHGQKVAAESILRALENKNSDDLVKALIEFIDMHK